MPSYLVITGKSQPGGPPNYDNAKFEGAIDEFVAWAQNRGLELDEPAYENRPHLKPALQGQPRFKGYWGPGSDGNPVRYEDWDTFNAMSR